MKIDHFVRLPIKVLLGKGVRKVVPSCAIWSIRDSHSRREYDLHTIPGSKRRNYCIITIRIMTVNEFKIFNFQGSGAKLPYYFAVRFGQVMFEIQIGRENKNSKGFLNVRYSKKCNEVSGQLQN